MTACCFSPPQSGSGRKKSPVQSKKGVPHRSIKDLLPPTPEQELPQQPAAEPDAGVRYYESVDSRQQRQASVPTLQYSSVSEEEKGTKHATLSVDVVEAHGCGFKCQK